MTLIFKSTYDDTAAWRKYLQPHFPDLEVRLWPEVGRIEDVEFALVWKPEPGDLKRYPNLKAIFSLGAGVDHIFLDPQLPTHIPVTRIVDPGLAAQMSEYATYGVLHFHRRMDYYARCQREEKWGEPGRTDTHTANVGIMGIGQIGGDAARKLKALGLPVAGWSRTPKRIEGIECFHGSAGLKPFLTRSKFLVCVLPLTSATNGIINKDTLAMLPVGAYFINMARGSHVKDEHLLAALDSGHVAGAMLDVLPHEPLPSGHPYWRHPKVVVTPHIAGDPDPRTAADQVIDNIRRARTGQTLLNLVDPSAEY